LTFTLTITFSPSMRIGTVQACARSPGPAISTGVRPLNESRKRISARVQSAFSL
jgi:hypothetical protein